MKDIKTRKFPNENYRAIYHNGKTLRMQYDRNKPIADLNYPEFYDIKITSYCEGNCPWCYMNSTCKGHHFDDILGKVDKFFGGMSENERPFQVAIGGGEPTMHPDFIPLLKKLRELGISPNYTTNGMNMTSDILDATEKYCEGVAVSAHPHLESIWNDAFFALTDRDIKTNFHIIISDRDSIEYFKDIYQAYNGRAFYFVLLPYEKAGRAKSKDTDFDYMFSELKKFDDISGIAFGALFYPYLKKHPWLDLSLYEPEIMSKFLDMDSMTLYPSSFATDQPLKKVV